MKARKSNVMKNIKLRETSTLTQAKTLKMPEMP